MVGTNMKKIFYNADVVTMDEAMPNCQAVVVEDGKIVFAGSNEDALKMDADEKVDLAGKTLMPSFIDAHSHFSGVAFSYIQVNIGEAACFEDIKIKIEDHIKYNNIPDGKWISCTGYDHNNLEEKEHPTKAWLDSFSPKHPVVLQHKSGHMGVFNTLALKQMGITVDTPTPNGGVIGKDENGELNGYMEETIYVDTIKSAPMPAPQEIFGGFVQGQDKFASYGVTTVQEGMFVNELVQMYQALIAQNMLKIDVVSYVDFSKCDSLIEMFKDHFKQYKNRFKIAGLKMFLDGSPQGRTAWMETPYEGGDGEYKGYGIMPDEVVTGAIKKAGALNVPIHAHTNGDAAAAQFIRCVEAAEKDDPSIKDNRVTMVHAQLLRPDQMPKMKELGMMITFFVAHVWHWGDVHIKNFGRARAEMISSVKSAIDLGIPYTFHQDCPVIEPNMLETVWCAVNRITKKGEVLGADQKISAYEALKGITINAAYEYFEEDTKGSITVGKLADLVILDQNPLKVDPMAIKDIAVLETIKEGNTIFKKA